MYNLSAGGQDTGRVCYLSFHRILQNLIKLLVALLNSITSYKDIVTQNNDY